MIELRMQKYRYFLNQLRWRFKYVTGIRLPKLKIKGVRRYRPRIQLNNRLHSAFYDFMFKLNKRKMKIRRVRTYGFFGNKQSVCKTKNDFTWFNCKFKSDLR